MNDGVVRRSIEDTEATADGGRVIAEYVPREADSRSEIILVGMYGFRQTVHFVSQSQIERKVFSNLPSILQVDAAIRLNRPHRWISESDLEILGETEIERLNGCDRCRTQRGINHSPRQGSKVEAAGEEDMGF